MNTIIIGLTGGIGTGKSTAAGFLKEYGITIINADDVGHRLLEEDKVIHQEVVNTFGRGILTEDGKINRNVLGKIVFADKALLKKLNEITHQRIHDDVKAQIERYRDDGIKVIVVDAPLLIEAGRASMVDEIWVTLTDRETVFERLNKRMGLGRDEVLLRVNAQMPAEERVKYADVVIDNNGTLEELENKVFLLYKEHICPSD